ncbi:MAG TPA: hypothetical protein VLN73_05495 [Alphaproteobacteria bacterium]|nr:hypothetical protein [Alphaproteobacteria bacterium]
MRDFLRYAMLAAVIGAALLIAAGAAGFIGAGIADWMARFTKWDF